MIPKNQENSRKVQLLLNHMRSLKRGDLIRYEDIEFITGIFRHSARWSWLTSRLKKEFQRERGITLMAEHGVGYKLCTKDEQLKAFPRKQQKRAERRLNDGMSAIESLDLKDLSLAEKQYRALVLQNSVEDASNIRRHVRQQDGFLRKSQTSPRPAHA